LGLRGHGVISRGNQGSRACNEGKHGRIVNREQPSPGLGFSPSFLSWNSLFEDCR
jgi:hypothetical protein